MQTPIKVVEDVDHFDNIIAKTKFFKHKSLEERADEYGGQLNLDGEYDWVEPVGREVW